MYLVLYLRHPHTMLPIAGLSNESLKVTFFIIVLVGITVVDLLYIQILLRYVLQCQLNIYFLQLIINKVESKKYKSQNEAIEDVERAQKFLKQLNRSSKIIGFATTIVMVQALECASNLSKYIDDGDENPHSQLEKVALTCRLFLWTFIAMVPFIQAARVNETSQALRDTGLVMYRITLQKSVKVRINIINARLFGINVQPGFKYLAVIMILLSFALGSTFLLFEQLYITAYEYIYNYYCTKLCSTCTNV